MLLNSCGKSYQKQPNSGSGAEEVSFCFVNDSNVMERRVCLIPRTKNNMRFQGNVAIGILL